MTARDLHYNPLTTHIVVRRRGVITFTKVEDSGMCITLVHCLVHKP